MAKKPENPTPSRSNLSKTVAEGDRIATDKHVNMQKPFNRWTITTTKMGTATGSRKSARVTLKVVNYKPASSLAKPPFASSIKNAINNDKLLMNYGTHRGGNDDIKTQLRSTMHIRPAKIGRENV